MREEVINMKTLHMVAFALLLVGGLNWGLVGFFNYNLVSMLFGSMPSVEKLVYVVVGLSAAYVVVTHTKDCKWCGGKGKK